MLYKKYTNFQKAVQGGQRAPRRFRFPRKNAPAGARSLLCGQSKFFRMEATASSVTGTGLLSARPLVKAWAVM